MKKIKLFLVIGLITSGVYAQYSKNKQIEYVKVLASDEMEGRKFGTEGGVKASEYIANQFKENDLKPCIGDSYLVPFEYKGKKGFNVCGIKEGKSDEIIAFGAHYDHIGVNTKGEDIIYNGADDNASGTSVVMALSDYFKNKKTAKSIMFMAFDAEEVGLIGSGQLIENLDFKQYLPKIEVMYNLEMLGTPSAFGNGKVYMTGSDRSDLMNLLNENSCSSFKVASDPYLSQNLFMRSDNVHFVNKGIVSHSLSTVDMENQKHYHQANDEFGIINVDNLSKITKGLGRATNKMMKKNIKPKYNE